MELERAPDHYDFEQQA